MGQGYYYTTETPTYEYTVSVKPAPADESKATLHRHTETGPVIETKQLKKVGEGKLPIPLSRFTVKDSPIVVQFSFAKKGQKPHTQAQRLSLALGVPSKVNAPGEAKVDDKIKLEVAAWAALLHDTAGKPPREQPEDQPNRISKDTKKSVKWRIEYGKKKTDLNATGESVELRIVEEYVGQTLDVYAYVGDFDKRAHAKVVVSRPIVLALSWKDPDGKAHAFPEGFPVSPYYDGDAEKNSLKTDKKGVLAFQAPGKKKWLSLKLDSKDLYVCLAADGKEVTLATTDTVAAQVRKGYRAFSLPENISLAESVWEVKGTKTWSDTAYRFELTGEIGTEKKPVTMLLDPLWHYVRFEFFDRLYGEKEHRNRRMPVPPLYVEAYANAADRVADSRCHWPVAQDDTSKSAQAVPWIRQRTKAGVAKPKPDKVAEYQFRTDLPMFIISSSATERKLGRILDPKRTRPSAKRLELYDLPPVWRSRGYWARPKTGTAAFFEKLDARSLQDSSSKDNPIVFCLDDIVLCDARKRPIALAANDLVTVFHHGFSSSAPPANVSATGVYKAGTDGTKPYTPYSDVKVEAGNYLTDYADWTRLVLANGNVHDVFADRTAEGASTVGARAAVMHVDLIAEGPRPGTGQTTHAKPKPKLRGGDAPEFFCAEASIKGEYDKGKSGERATGVYKEWETPYVYDWGYGFGRSDFVLLRCCGADGDTELGLRMDYFRFDLNFAAVASSMTAAGQAVWRKDCLERIANRFNGLDATNTTPTTFEPVDATLKLVVRNFWFIQQVPNGREHFAIAVTAGGNRSFMGNSGNGQFGTSDNAPDGSGSFIAAHETGHGSGLPDEYNETGAACSYGGTGFNNHLTGAPFGWDPDSMMFSNKRPRPRHHWHAAEWLRNATSMDWKLVQGGNKFHLPPHPTHAPQRTWAYAPVWHEVAATAGRRGRFNTALFHHLAAPGEFDGLLRVWVKIKIKTPGMAASAIYKFVNDLAQAASTTIDGGIATPFYVNGDVGNGTRLGADKFHFDRCAVTFTARFLMETLEPANFTAADNLAWYLGVNYVTNGTGREPADYKAKVDFIEGLWPRDFHITVQSRDASAWTDTRALRYKLDPRGNDAAYLDDYFHEMVGLEGGYDAAHIKATIVDRIFQPGAVVTP